MTRTIICTWREADDAVYIVRSCNHYALFVIIAQILQNLAFPLFTAIIKTQNLCKFIRSTLENSKSYPRNDMQRCKLKFFVRNN